MTTQKDLPVLPDAVYFGCGPDGDYFGYDEEHMQAYGQQCAAHAREMALEEARQVAENCDVVEVKGTNYHAQLGDAAATHRGIVNAIEALKGK